MVFSLPDITSAQVHQIIKGISPYKAAGIDKITIGCAYCYAFRSTKYCKDNQLVVFYCKISCWLENCQDDTSV